MDTVNNVGPIDLLFLLTIGIKDVVAMSGWVSIHF
jgi:hypothetical protein